ncbi:MAG: hypothetical protein KJ621_07615 [Proteobacteria bacterium]|nr:hypothetical protein [Pseudomonadota bacterium]
MISIDETDVPSVEALYKRLLDRSPLPLPGFESIVESKALARATRIHDYLLDRADLVGVDCYLCGEKPARKSETRWVYETPWQEEEVPKHFCSEECADIYLYEEPFAYFWCDPCGREICQQNPRNGWQVQYRDLDGELVCLRCYEGHILENGVEREKLEAGQIPGMFFSYGNPEPLDAGYEEIDGFSNFFVRTADQAEAFRSKALDLMDQGYRVVIGYERMAIGGLEGYVTLLAKRADLQEEEVIPCEA